jgi:hypothetical protein
LIQEPRGIQIIEQGRPWGETAHWSTLSGDSGHSPVSPRTR